MLIVEKTTDLNLVKELITRPEIWERAAEDGLNPDEYFPSYNDMTAWLVCKEGKENIGIMLIHIDTSISAILHPYLIKAGKGQKMIKAFYRWFLDNTPLLKINVAIPELYKEVIAFSKSMGFKDEGFNRSSYMKDGKVYGQINMGIERDEIVERLK